jgi:hypothetical protein
VRGARRFFGGLLTYTCAADASVPLPTSMRRPTARIRVSVRSSVAGRTKARGPNSKSRRNLAVSVQAARQATTGVGPLPAGSPSAPTHGHGGACHLDTPRRTERSANWARRGAEARVSSQSGSRSDCRACAPCVLCRLARCSADAAGLSSAGCGDWLFRLIARGECDLARSSMSSWSRDSKSMHSGDTKDSGRLRTADAISRPDTLASGLQENADGCPGDRIPFGWSASTSVSC